ETAAFASWTMSSTGGADDSGQPLPDCKVEADQVDGNIPAELKDLSTAGLTLTMENDPPKAWSSAQSTAASPEQVANCVFGTPFLLPEYLFSGVHPDEAGDLVPPGNVNFEKLP